MPGRWRGRVASGGAAVMLENTSASELKTGTDHFLVAARVEFGTGNSPRGVHWANPSGCGSDAGQVVRPGGFDGRQVVRPGFYAGQECGALGIEAVGRAIKRGWASQY